MSVIRENALIKPILKSGRNFSHIKKNWELYLFVLPCVLWFIVFKYVPMYGVQIAFKDFIATRGIWDSPWVGFKHFERFFNSYNFQLLLKNTLGLSLMQLVIGFPLPIIIALMLNQLTSERFKRIVQTVIYAPNFISVVVLVGMIYVFLSPSSGMVNHVIKLFGGEPVFFMGSAAWFKPLYVLSGVWQETGFATIIYLAALAGINPDLHEAAVVDGATKFKRILHIDIPGILPISIILLILAVGNMMNLGFEKALLMQTDLNKSSSSIIQTYVYEVGLVKAQYSFSAAVGLFNSVINLVLLLSVNRFARKVSETSLW
ncbi:MAG TPA: ABC transporter permease subunit [Bacilli bacterium]